MAEAASGRGRPVVIEGAAGAGKSALIAAATDQARSAGLLVLTARGTEMEREFAFGVVRQLVEGTLADATPRRRERLLARGATPAAVAMAPGGDIPAGQAPAGPEVLNAFAVLVANLAAEQPLMLAVDDLHWTDVSSVRALSYAAGRIADAPVALVVGLRPDEPGAPEQLLDGLRSEPTALRVPVTPLEFDAVAELVRRRLPQADDAVCRAFDAATAGNPLYLQELLRTLAAAGSRNGALQDAVREASLPPLGDRVARRIAPVAEGAPALASAMAVIGDGGALTLAAALAGLSRVDAGKIASRLQRIEVLSAEDPFVFVHPLVRRSIYDAIPVPDRDAAHSAAADLLEPGAASVEVVAAHRGAITPGGSEQVATMLCRAAEQALARAAPDEAVRWLRRAVDERAVRPPPEEILALLGTTEIILWDNRAIGHLQHALELTDSVDFRARVSLPLAEMLFLTGQWAEAMDVIVAALAELGDAHDEAAAGLTAIGLMTMGYAPFAAGLLDDSPAALERLMKGPSWAAHALAAVLAAMTVHRGGDPARVRSLVDAALADDVLLEVRGRETWAVAHALIALAEIDDHERGLAFGERVIVAARQAGLPNLTAAGTSHLGWLLARRGDLPAAEAALRPRLEEALELGAPTVVVSILFYIQDALLECTSLEDVAAVAEAGDPDRWGLTGTLMEAMFRTARGRLRAARGDRPGALVDLRTAMDIAALLGVAPTVFPARSLVALALPADDRAEARALVDEELAVARSAGYDRPIGLALRAAATMEQGDRAAELLADALPFLERAGARLERARTHIALGATLRRAGHRGRAQPELVRGMELARACGADRLVAHALEELRAAGARPRRSATTGPGALTASELRVARLAAGGASNQDIARDLFVSPKTIETHLSHAYAKLGLAGQGSRDLLGEALGT